MGYEGPVELSGKRSPSSEAAPGTLRVRVGHASVVGARQANEDFFGVVTPDGSELAAKGILAAVADGVSGGSGGRQAAEHVVRSLLADYYATPDTWEVPLAIERVLSAANRWLLAQGAPSGMASTLSALLLRGTRYYLAHVGDTRVYRLSGDECAQLTQDHVWDRPGMQHVLKRAVGLDRHLAIDCADGELRADDAFLLCSDGLWQPLGQKRVHELLRLYDDPQFVADALVAAALGEGGRDNATALVVRVDAIAKPGWRDALGAGLRLPVPARLKPGQRIDEFEVLSLLHESRATLLYTVRSLRSGQVLALKTLHPRLAEDRESCEGLLAEEWLAKRLVSPHFPQIVPLSPAARHF